tara:strand:+ start:734 stop:1048 length:315 start_codon:yes stop_codon:yes gene_type:complete
MRNKKRRVRKNTKNNTFRIFIMYVLSIFTFSVFLITFLTIKNQCAKLKYEITELKKAKINNTIIVKKLQSDKDFFLSEQYISSRVQDVMVAIAPEPEIINMENE